MLDKKKKSTLSPSADPASALKFPFVFQKGWRVLWCLLYDLNASFVFWRTLAHLLLSLRFPLCKLFPLRFIFRRGILSGSEMGWCSLKSVVVVVFANTIAAYFLCLLVFDEMFQFRPRGKIELLRKCFSSLLELSIIFLLFTIGFFQKLTQSKYL